jgi:hypothetical protein
MLIGWKYQKMEKNKNNFGSRSQIARFYGGFSVQKIKVGGKI